MTRTIATLAALLTLAACSSPTTPEPPRQTAPASSPTATPTPSPTVEVQTLVNGKAYPEAYATCVQALWDQRVAQWNALTDQQRDQHDSAEAWMTDQGWPTTYEATLDDPATETHCPR